MPVDVEADRVGAEEDAATWDVELRRLLAVDVVVEAGWWFGAGGRAGTTGISGSTGRGTATAETSVSGCLFTSACELC